MQIQCDDELYRLNRIYLGPPHKPWPFRQTYRMFVMWGVLFVVCVIGWRLIGLPWNVVVVILLAAGTFFAGSWLDKKLTVDRPLSAEVQRIGQDLLTPRPEKTTPRVYELQAAVERWPVYATPDPHGVAKLVHKIAAVREAVVGRKKAKRIVDGKWQSVR